MLNKIRSPKKSNRLRKNLLRGLVVPAAIGGWASCSWYLGPTSVSSPVKAGSVMNPNSRLQSLKFWQNYSYAGDNQGNGTETISTAVPHEMICGGFALALSSLPLTFIKADSKQSSDLSDRIRKLLTSGLAVRERVLVSDSFEYESAEQLIPMFGYRQIEYSL